MAVKNFRIGNDLVVLWAICNRNGSPYDLANKHVRLYVINERGRREVEPIITTLPDGTINNVIRWDFNGMEQRVTGLYTLSVEILTASDKKSIKKDYCEAFNLVGSSSLEDESLEENISDGGELILSSSLDVIRLSVQGEFGSEIDDVKNSLKDINDALVGINQESANIKVTINGIQSTVNDIGTELTNKASVDSVVKIGDYVTEIQNNQYEQSVQLNALGVELSTKASSESVTKIADNLVITNNTLAEQTTKVNDLEVEISTKAEASQVTEIEEGLKAASDSIAEQTAKVTALSSQISTKAETETVTQLGQSVNIVSQNLAEQTLRTDGIEASIETLVTNEVFNAATGEIESRFISVEQKAESIETTIKSQGGEITSIKENVDGLSVGIGNLENDLDSLRNQIDGVTESFFYDYIPENTNEPAKTWIEQGKEAEHKGDTFTNTSLDGEDAGKSWRWLQDDNGNWGWTPIADTDALKALEAAAKAQKAADGKVTIFYIQPSNYKEGDIWFVHNDEYSPYEKGEILTAIAVGTIFSLSDWESKTRYTEAVKDLDKTMNTTFKDGVLDEAERLTIIESVTALTNEKSAVDARYNITIVNSDFTDETLKNEYKATKATYDSAYNNLVGIVEQIADAKAESLKDLFDSYTTASENYTEAYSAHNEKETQVTEALMGRLNSASRYLDNITNDGILTPIEKEQLFEIYRSIAREYDATRSNAFNYKVWKYSNDGVTEESGLNGGERRYESYVAFKNAYTAIANVFSSSMWGFTKMDESTTLPEGYTTTLLKSYLDTYYEAYGILTESFSAITAAIEAAQKAAEETLQGLTDNLRPEEMSTIVGKGVVLSTIIATKDGSGKLTAGINGSLDQNKGEKSIAAWFGGDVVDVELDTDMPNPASSVIRHDGTGYFAKGLFSWDDSTGINLGKGGIKINYDGSLDFGDDIRIGGTETLGSLLKIVSKLSSMWRLENGVLKTDYDVLTNGQFAAATIGESTGGGVAYLADLYDVSLGSLLSGDLLSWNGSEWVNIKQSSLVPDLSAYATKSFVTDSLVGYATQSDVTSALSNYLPLSGGSISGNITLGGYIVKNDHFFGVEGNDNADWWVTDKGWQHTYTLIHSGNIGSQNVAYASTAYNATNAEYTNGFKTNTSNTGIDFNSLTTPTAWCYGQGGSVLNKPNGFVFGAVLQIKQEGHHDLNSQFAWDVNHNSATPTKELWFRASNNLGWGNDWKTIAFTDSNVASAQALVHSNGAVGATVSEAGNLIIKRKISSADDSLNLFEYSAGFLYLGYSLRNEYTTRVYGNKIEFLTGDTQKMLINPSGNVTIGNSDLAGTSARLHVAGNVMVTDNLTIGGDINVYSPSARSTIRLVSQSDVPNDLIFGSNGRQDWSITSRDSSSKHGIGLYNYKKDWALFVAGDTNNVIVGSAEDSGYKLDVNGTLRVTDTITAQNGIVTNEISIGGVRIDSVGGVLRINGDVFSTGQFAASLVGQEGGGGGAAYLSDLYDVSLGSLLSGDILSWNGSEWVNIKQSSLVPDLSAYASKSFVSDALEGYLPKSGGTIDSTSWLPLVINSSFYDGSVAIQLSSNGVTKAGVVYNSEGAYIYNYSLGYYLGISDSGHPNYNGHTLYHSGNFNPANYLPLTGGTINGSLILNSPNSDYALHFQTGLGAGWIGFQANSERWFVTNRNWSADYTLLHSGNYSDYALPLSGGWIESNISSPLGINSTSQAEVGVYYVMNSVYKGWIGYNPTYGTTLYNYASTAYLGLRDNGKAYLNANELLHSGNIEDYAGIYLINAIIDLNESRNGFRAGKLYGSPNAANDVASYRGLLEYGVEGYVAQFNSDGQNNLFYRWCENGTWLPWKTIAYTDSTVAAAKELVTSAGTVYASTDGSSYTALGLHGADTYINGKQCKITHGDSSTTGFVLNEYGNVTLSYTDFAGTNAKLYVVGNLRLEGELEFLGGYSIQSYNSSPLSINAQGNNILLNENGYSNVLIGTTADRGYKLDVNGNIGTSGELFLNNNKAIRMAGGDGRYYNPMFMSGNDLNIGYDSPVIRFGGSKIYIGESGNVLIGTTTDKLIGKLQINGNVVIGNSADSEIYMCRPYINRFCAAEAGGSFAWRVDGSDVDIMSLSTSGILTANNGIVTNEITIGGIKLDVYNGALRVNGDIFSTGQFAASVAGEATGSSNIVLDYASIVNALGYTPANQNSLSQVAYTGSYTNLVNKPDIYTKQEVNNLLAQQGGSGGSVGNNYMLYEINNGSHTIPNGVNSVIAEEDINMYFDMVTPADITKPCIIYLVKGYSCNLYIYSGSNIWAANDSGGLLEDFTLEDYMGMTLVWDTYNYRWMAYLQN